MMHLNLFRLAMVVCFGPALCLAQTAGPSPASASSSNQFVNLAFLPAPARGYLSAFGDRIQKAGKERTTLSGTFTDASGASTSAQLVWQVPGQIHFSRTGQPPLIFGTTAGLVNATGLASTEANILESLFDDTAESFLYGFKGGAAYRLLGQGFRADSSNTKNYTGPWYDIYENTAKALAQPGATIRNKVYYFDTQSKLLAKVTYISGGTHVETDIAGWTRSGGQSFPGQIVRKENGSTIFTFAVTSDSVGPAVNDGLFNGQ